MGEVYLAHDPRLGRKVAVKLLRSELTGHPDVTRRFEQEARAASSLNHPNIVTIYEIGEVGERRFLAMEFVDGQPLAAFVGRPAGVDWVARVGAQLAQALTAAHAAGIVHRDSNRRTCWCGATATSSCSTSDWRACCPRRRPTLRRARATPVPT